MNERFDLILTACGYESRARYLAAELTRDTPHRIAWRFSSQRVLAFGRNEAFFEAAGYTFLDVPEKDFTKALLGVLGDQPVESSKLRVLVDISSHTRARLAAIISAMEQLSSGLPIEVVFGYTLATYDGLGTKQLPNVEIGPVSARFAGWTADPELPLVLIVGLGYEQDRALGAFECLEPAATWALLPQSPLTGYGRALRDANALLMEGIPPEHLIRYEVADPNATYAKLASLIHHAGRTGSVILLPGGPKILALLSLLVALERQDVAVWRVSAGGLEEPRDRRPAGKKVFVRYAFESRRDGKLRESAVQREPVERRT